MPSDVCGESTKVDGMSHSLPGPAAEWSPSATNAAPACTHQATHSLPLGLRCLSYRKRSEVGHPKETHFCFCPHLSYNTHLI